MPEEFTLSSSLMNINLDREILDHPSATGAADFDARSSELMQALLSSQANGTLGSSMSFRARKPADLSIDASGRGGRGGGGLYSPFGPSSRGSFGARSPTSGAHLRLLQHSNGGPRAASPAAALASLAAGSGLTVVMGGPSNASPRPELAGSAASAAAALGAAAAKAFADLQMPPKSSGQDYLMGRGGADFFLDSPSGTRPWRV